MAKTVRSSTASRPDLWNVPRRECYNSYPQKTKAMLALIISLLLSIGVITSADDFTNADAQRQQELTNIIIDDIEDS